MSSVCTVELSVWMGVCGCGCPNSSNVCRIDTAVLALMNSAPSLASAANDITVLIICKMFNTAPVVDGDFFRAGHKYVASGLAVGFWFG